MSNNYFPYKELEIANDDICENKLIKLFHNCASFCHSNPGVLNEHKQYAWVYMLLELNIKGIIDVNEEFIDIFIANVYPEFYIHYKESENE